MNAQDLRRALANFNCKPPAAPEAVEKFELAAGLHLPLEYVSFLRVGDGGEGFVGPNAYVILWRVEDLLELNAGYEAEEYAPGLLLFRSNGGGEAFAFDMRKESWPIVSIPFVGMTLDLAEPVSDTFQGFLGALYGS